MKKHKLDPLASIYIADSAFVTKENLDKAEQNQLDVISRLPATYAEEQRVITLSMQHPDKWIEIGSLQDTVVGKETARYRYQEQCVDLYGKEYRAIVIHSSSHDKRRQKKLERALLLEEQKLNKKIKALEKQKFHCCEDAKNTTEKDISGCNLKYHQTRIEIEEIKSNKRGRPRKGQEPETGKIEYCVKVLLIRDEESIQKLKEQSGCFVLITTVNPNRHDGKAILQAYKQQNGVEMNFRFLKDPLIVNDTFLKKAERIEALGVILLLSLMIWNLIQHLLRRYINQNEENSIE
ncbi:MAG: IS1634 family transposase, partial [Bacteroidetes bacterium]|nr:IS1634 family transposase [Bacteroidota bacterium]